MRCREWPAGSWTTETEADWAAKLKLALKAKDWNWKARDKQRQKVKNLYWFLDLNEIVKTAGLHWYLMTKKEM